MAKILVVEDEKNISKLIADTLSLGNYETDYAFDGEEALEKINQNKYDLILLDVMLPKIDGFQLVEQMKHKTPVIFLSAKNDVASIVKGLKSGGQDYMTKPFEPLELLARIELRLEKKAKVQSYKDIAVHNQERQVYQNGVKVELTPKEYELLALLVENVDKALTRDEILDKVWNINAEIETRTVDYHIQQLRRKLNLKEDIITVNKVGYRLRGEKRHEV